MGCVHRWVIEPPVPERSWVVGVCKHCQATRQFDAWGPSENEVGKPRRSVVRGLKRAHSLARARPPSPNVVRRIERTVLRHRQVPVSRMQSLLGLSAERVIASALASDILDVIDGTIVLRADAEHGLDAPQSLI